jgi:hypothetical protein
MAEAHAVQVVGYDNTRQAWLIKNSWGPGFAAKGFAWVSFDAPSMCDPQDTYGFIFQSYLAPPAAHSSLVAAPGRKGCYTYRAVAGDYPQGLASRFGLRVQQLLLDNLAVVEDPSIVPAGTVLTLCGVSAEALAGAATFVSREESPTSVLPATQNNSNSNSSSSSSRQEVGVLMAVKRVLNPVADALADWQLGSPNPCGWTGVTCDTGTGRVTDIIFWDQAANTSKVQLSGGLPSGALLRRLLALKRIALPRSGVRGTLPEDWSQLQQLAVVSLYDNKLTGERRGRYTKAHFSAITAVWQQPT